MLAARRAPVRLFDLEFADFIGPEVSPLAWFHICQFQRSNADALDAKYGQPGQFSHLTNLALSPSFKMTRSQAPLPATDSIRT
jgi:hypothetical protein